MASALSFAAFGALGVAAFALGRNVAGAACGVVLAAILLTRETLVSGLLQGLVEIPFLALVLAAVALAVPRPAGAAPRSAGALALAALVAAGLLRPEAWPLAVIAAVLLGRDATARQRLGLAAAALAAPVAWSAMDLLVTGDPLHSLTGTRELADRLERPRGLATALDFAPGYLGDVLGGALAVAGLAGLALAAWRAPERALPALVVLALGVAGFLVLGVAGLPLLIRYLLLPAALLGLFAAFALTGWSAVGGTGPLRAAWAVGAAVLVVWVIAGVPAERDSLASLGALTRERAGLERELRALVARPDARRRIERCGPLYAANSRPVPVIAQRLRLAPERIRSAVYERPTGGTYLSPEPGTGRRYLLDAREPQTDPAPPAGFRPVARNGAWQLSARCPAGVSAG